MMKVDLAEKLPAHCLRALVREFGGRVIRVPRQLPAVRDATVRQMLSELLDQTYGEVAATHKLSVRTVKRIAKRITS